MGARWWLLVMGAAVLALAGCRAEKAPQSAAPTPAAQAEPASAVAWLDNYEEGLKKSAQEGKPLMVDVFAPWCSACKKLDREVFSRSDVGELSRRFVAVKVNGDERQDLVRKLKVSGYPTTVFMTADEEELTRVRGAVPYEHMLEAMRDALSAFEKQK